MAEFVSPTAGLVEAIDEKTCLLTAGAHSLDGFAVHLAIIGVDFEVLEPPELAARLGTLAERLTRAARLSRTT